MNGRILTERLLATSSLAALILAAASQQNAYATVGCSLSVPSAGSALLNSGAIPCIQVTGANISLTNAASGTIGPPTTGGNIAVSVTNTGSLSGGIVNAGRIVGPAGNGTTIGIGVAGIVHGGISNSGTVTINASNAGFVGVYGVDVGSSVGGTPATFAGGLSNSGTVAINATASGGIMDAVVINADTIFGNITNAAGGTISATATGTGAANSVSVLGLFFGGQSFGGGTVINNGTITATAIHNGSQSASATGFEFDITSNANVTNGIVNSGTISGVATAAAGSASAYGVTLSGSLFTGGVSNGGSIGAQAASTGGEASAIGLAVAATTFIGNIVNSGTIAASAQSGSTWACATGVSPSTSLMVGNFSNAGTITATATASGSARAFATGAVINVETLIGGVINSGTITATATGPNATATALAQYNCNGAHSGTLPTLVTGGVSNTGSLSAIATATSGNATANGAGLGAYSTSSPVAFNGFNNAGLISATAVGAGTAFACGTAASIYLAGAGSAVLSGDVTNSGSIVVTGTATGSGFVRARALAVEVSGLSFGQTAAINGNIANSGLISATATSAQNYAVATAASLYAYQLNGNITNSGTITATANGTAVEATALEFEITSFNGGFSNSGMIAATANGAAAEANALAFQVTSFNGGFSNSGTIAAAAISSGGATLGAIARGIWGGPTFMLGDVANSGVISATATQTAVNGNACAEAIAMSVYASTMLGNFTNSGTIAARAISSESGLFASAVATGASFGASFMIGNVLNSGMISAAATQNGGNTCARALAMKVYGNTMIGNVSNSGTIAAVGTALAGHATVTGASVSVSTFVGSIINSGTIAASATGNFGCAVGVKINTTSLTGNFTNSGTIAASFTATGGGSGVATAIAFNATSFSGTVTNSGTIAATLTGHGTATGIKVFDLTAGSLTIANSGTISAVANTAGAHAIGIDLSCLNAIPITINQTGGLISAATAIAFSANGDTLNASGGKIAGNLVGPTSGTLPTINVAAGAGGTFTYAGTTTNIGVINANSGTFLLATQASGAASVVNTVTFTQAAGATLGLGALPAAISSVTASGALTLAGPLVVYEGAAGWNPGTTYTYANALTGDTLTGAFNSVGSNSPLFTASAATVGNSETVTLGLLPLGSVPGLSNNDRSVLGALETLLANPNTPASVVNTLGQIYTLNSTSQVGALATSLSGEQNTQNFQFSESAWSQFSSMLMDRLFGDGGEGTTTGVASFTKGQGLQFAQADIPQVAQATDAGGRAGGVPAGRQPSKWGVWARGYGSWASAPSTASSASYDESGAGVILGGDAQITNNLVGGFAFNIGTDTVSGGSHNNINTYQGAFYGKYNVDPHIYVAGLAGFGWQDYDSRRFIMAPISANATANYSGQGYRFYGESGYAFHLAGPLPETSVTPYLGLGYLHSHIDGFTEAGGGGAALSVGAVDANSFTTSLGARASTVFRIGQMALKPEVRAAWEHEWLDQSTNVQSSFAAAPGSVFTVTGAGFGRDSFVGGAGISTTLAGFGVNDPRFASTQLFVDYDVKTTGGYVANVVSGGLRAKF